MAVADGLRRRHRQRRSELHLHIDVINAGLPFSMLIARMQRTANSDDVLQLVNKSATPIARRVFGESCSAAALATKLIEKAFLLAGFVAECVWRHYAGIILVIGADVLFRQNGGFYGVVFRTWHK